MSEEPKVARYAVYNRVELALGFVLVAFMAYVTVYFVYSASCVWGRCTLWEIAPYLVLLAFFLPATIVATFYLRLILYFASTYAYTNAWVEAYDPLLRRRVRISFDEVSRIGSEYVPAGHAWQRSIRRVHTLESDDGRRIRMSEGLACWPEIRFRCCNAEYEKLDSKFFGVKE